MFTYLLIYTDGTEKTIQCTDGITLAQGLIIHKNNNGLETIEIMQNVRSVELKDKPIGKSKIFGLDGSPADAPRTILPRG